MYNEIFSFTNTNGVKKDSTIQTVEVVCLQEFNADSFQEKSCKYYLFSIYLCPYVILVLGKTISLPEGEKVTSMLDLGEEIWAGTSNGNLYMIDKKVTMNLNVSTFLTDFLRL